MRCEQKGCAFPALPNDKFCKAHSIKPLEPLVPAVSNGDFDIVDMAAVPQFRVYNEKNDAYLAAASTAVPKLILFSVPISFAIAKAVSVLGPGKALRVRCDKSKATSFAASVVTYGKRMGVKIHNRNAGGFAYFFKPDATKK